MSDGLEDIGFDIVIELSTMNYKVEKHLTKYDAFQCVNEFIGYNFVQVLVRLPEINAMFSLQIP